MNSNTQINKEENDEILIIPSSSENLEEKDKILCDFIIKEKLGEGTFGKVKLGINRQTNETVAIKILDKKRIVKERDKKRLEREINILKSLRHPNIVFLYCDIQTNSYIYLIMEYIKGTELLHYISANSKLTEEEACFYFRQIISSIEYLHKLKISHRDIKPENMIIENSTKIIKLVDFGLSNYYNNKNEVLSSACGSPSYAAPEMLSGKKYSAAPVDVWSCGIVLYAMICGYLPFEDFDNNILFKKIREGKFKIPTHVSENAKDLIKNILIVNPKKRYTIEQIKRHKWFRLCLDNEEYRNKKSLYEGLLLQNYIIPLDENIISKMNQEYDIDKENIRMCLLRNNHNDITTIYYLILLKNSKLGIDSVADLKGNEFEKYLKNKNNLLVNYDNDINRVIEEINKNKELEEIKNKEIINDTKKVLDNEQEINNTIENNLEEEENNIMNFDESKAEKKDKDLVIDNKEDKRILNENFNSKDEIKKINKIKIINRGNKNTTIEVSEKVEKRKKFINIKKEKENKNYSAIKRSHNPKLNIKIFNNKSKNKDNIKLLNQNKPKNNAFKINDIKRNLNAEKNKGLILESENNINNEIKTKVNLNKEKKHKTYKPNPLQIEKIKNKTIFKADDKKSKKIIAKNIDGGRMAKSVEKRQKYKNVENNLNKANKKEISHSPNLKIINNNKNNSIIKIKKSSILPVENHLSARLRKNKKLTYTSNNRKKVIPNTGNKEK